MAWPRAKRSFAGVLTLVAWLAAAASVSSCGPRENDAQLDPEKIVAKASLAVPGVWFPGEWNEIRVELGGSTVDLEGEIVIDWQSSDAPSCRVPFELPRQTTRRFSVPVVVPGALDLDTRNAWPAGIATARIRAGRFQRDLEIQFLSHEADAWILWVRDSAAPKVDLDPLLAQLSLPSSRTQIEIHSVAPGELPWLRDGFAPFSLVVLHESTLRGASSQSLDALRAWIESGGSLVAFPGPEWSSLPPALAEIVSVDAVGSASQPPLERLSKLRGVWRSLTPRSDATTLEGGLIARRLLGAGQVDVVAFTPEGEKFPSYREAREIHDFLGDALERSRQLASAGGPPLSLTTTYGQPPSVLSSMLEHLRSRIPLRPPARETLAIAIGVYILLAFLLPYFVLGRRRREWTYAVVILGSMGGVFLVQRVGVLTLLQEMRHEDVSIVRLAADSTHAYATSFIAIASPGHRSETLRATGGGDDRRVRVLRIAPPEKAYNAVPTLESRSALAFSPDGKQEPIPLDLRPSDPAYLRIDGPADASHLIEFTLRTRSNGARVITITNKANGDLTPFLLTAAGLGGAGPAIPSGATREILLDLDTLRRWQSSPSPSRSLPPLFPRDRKGRFASSANVPRTEAGPRETELSYVALLLRDAPRPLFETGIDADAESGTTVFLIPLET